MIVLKVSSTTRRGEAIENKKMFKKAAILGLFYHSFSVLTNKHYNFYNNIREKMYIQYPVLGFEPAASWT